MGNASTRLAVAALALVFVWVFVYWRTEVTPDDTSVRFGPNPADARPSDEPTSPLPESVIIERGPVTPPVPLPTPEPQQPEAEPIPSGIIPPSFYEYVIQQGDTAQSISARFYATPARWDAVMRANPRIDFSRVRAGRTIRVPIDPDNIQGIPAPEPADPDADDKPAAAPQTPPQPMEYLVRPGDTLSGIASKVYGRSSLWTVIRDANRDRVGEDGTRLRAGTTIYIPPNPQGAQ